MNKSIKVGLFGARSNGHDLGRFATEIKSELEKTPNFQVITPNDIADMTEFDIAVYASRTADQLEQAVMACEKYSSPLLVLSTDVSKELQELDPKCDVSLIPNSSAEVVDYMDEVVSFWSSHKGWSVCITEYHQSSKSSVSGTAVEIANKIQFPIAKIISVRDDTKAGKLFDIPKEQLNGYAVHQIEFTDPITKESKMFEIKVFGRDTYARGLIKIIEDRLAQA